MSAFMVIDSVVRMVRPIVVHFDHALRVVLVSRQFGESVNATSPSIMV